MARAGGHQIPAGVARGIIRPDLHPWRNSIDADRPRVALNISRIDTIRFVNTNFRGRKASRPVGIKICEREELLASVRVAPLQHGLDARRVQKQRLDGALLDQRTHVVRGEAANHLE